MPHTINAVKGRSNSGRENRKQPGDERRMMRSL